MTRALAALGMLVALSGVTVPVAAQTPTAEQLQIFQNLTPEQQQAVLESLGGDASAIDSPGLVNPSGPANGRPDQAAVRANRAPETVVPVAPVLAARDELVLDVKVREGQEAANLAKLNSTMSQLLSRNPYVLDGESQLLLPSFAPIALGGLTEEQAMQRLSLEPALAGLEVKLTRLPVEKVGAAGLDNFGYELFDNAPSTFSPVTDVPVPADYVVGPGDQFRIQLFGNQNSNRMLTVSREGLINFPELGPISVGGQTFSAARRIIEARVAQQMIGVQVSVALGDTRSIRVFVLGWARLPGTYTVSGLATMTAALFASGGVTESGSLRDIQLKRQGEVVRRLDLYDLLIRGDTSEDAKLLPGDVIFIPPVGDVVAIDGEVRRPAIYELRGATSVADLVQMAGGLTPEADARRTSITRVDDAGRRVVLDVAVGTPAGNSVPLRNGDALHVSGLRPQLDAGVTLLGFVHRPGLFAWRDGMRISDVIGSFEELKEGADKQYILVRRENGADRRVSLVSVDLAAALGARGSAADTQLQARDRIYVFELAPGRDRILKPLLDELRLQSSLSEPTAIVSVQGEIKVPGEYPLEPDMRVSDLLRAGGNLEPSAYGGSAELTRYVVNTNGVRETRLISIDLAALRRGEASADIALQPYDYLLVQATPEWSEQEKVTLSGEVRFPGQYPIRKGETLHEVLDRAGGLTAQAFAAGSAFTRADLKRLEQQQLDRLAENLRSNLVTLSIQSAQAGQEKSGEALLAGQTLLSQLQSARATGRFIIDLPGLLESEIGSEKDVLLRGGDELFIPKVRQEVTVLGEVQNASSHLYQRGLARSDYISVSGGATRRADTRHIYVVRADGRVATDKGMLPGDTIVVPVDVERTPRIPFWQAVTQILYNVAVSVAAVNSF